MTKLRKKGFTLIELIAVLVIMAILALIVTPLVMNIIRKAKLAADKRSIDAYGRSIELAIAGYLLDNGKFPTSVGELTIEYSGNKVECSTTQLNSDSSVYLTGCTVGGRTVDYTYGTDKAPSPTYPSYTVGDTVAYNNVNYYVIKGSRTAESSVTLLKSEPLSYSDVQTYSAGTGATISDNHGYGAMKYHSSSNAYDGSYIKATVDAWKVANAPAALEVRLIQFDEFENLGYVEGNVTPSDIGWKKTDNTPTWVYDSSCLWWTISPYNDSTSEVWYVDSDGNLKFGSIYGVISPVVRPVIVLPKSAL